MHRSLSSLWSDLRVLALVAPLVALSCSGSSSSSPNPIPTTTNTGAGTGTGGSNPAPISPASPSSPAPTPTAGGTAALSANYTSACSSCHGADGSSTSFKLIKGTTLTADVYKSKVRSGVGAMPPFNASQITDADIAADYAILKK